MSVSKKPSFFGSALAGACLAVIASVPLTAYLGAAFGDTYNARVAIYGGFLLWVLIGAVAVFMITRTSDKPLSAKGVLLWFVSTWLWPIPVLMAKRRSR